MGDVRIGMAYSESMNIVPYAASTADATIFLIILQHNMDNPIDSGDKGGCKFGIGSSFTEEKAAAGSTS